MKEVIDEIDDILAILDNSGKILIMNKSFQERFHELVEQQNDSIFEYVPSFEIERITKAISSAVEGNNSVIRVAWIGSNSAHRNNSKILRIVIEDQVFILLLIKEDLWQNSENSLLDRIVGQEEERERLGKELHDGLGQKLHVIHMMVHGLQRMNPQTNEFMEFSDELLEMVKSSIHTFDCIVKDVSPPNLKVKGLIKSIEDLFRESSACEDLRFELCLSGNPSVIDQFEINEQLSLYRIIQELIANIIKHSAATKALLNLTIENNSIKFIMTDNGKGFVQVDSLAGRGLVSIQNRLKMFKSDFGIFSDHGGTTVKFSIYA